MPQLLTVSRAARLAGVSRGAMQKKIKEGELPTFEGMVRIEDLLAAYPQTRLEDDSFIERLSHIRDSAYARRLRERVLPDPEVLITRIADLGRELGDTRSELTQLRSIISELEARLESNAAGESRDFSQNLEAWLREALARRADASSHHPLVVRDSYLRVMAAHVNVLPSRHDFFVDGSDTILDAALNVGLSFNYGCSNGNCGLCKARVLSGQVKKVRPHDYVLSETEKNQGMVLLCCHTAVTDLVIETDETGSTQAIPQQEIATRVRKIERPGDDMVLLHLQTPRTRRLRFLAGQSVRLQAAAGIGVDYPIASCPCDDRNLQFHIARRSDDAFAQTVFQGLRVGDTVTLTGPTGHFVLREDSPNTLVFVAEDAGFAPIKSLIEHAMALDMADAIHLYWFASPPNGHYQSNLCRAWSDALDNFHFTPIPVRSGPPLTAEGWQTALMELAGAHRPLADRDIYVAGSSTLLEVARSVLPEQGLPEKQLRLWDVSRSDS